MPANPNRDLKSGRADKKNEKQPNRGSELLPDIVDSATVFGSGNQDG